MSSCCLSRLQPESRAQYGSSQHGSSWSRFGVLGLVASVVLATSYPEGRAQAQTPAGFEPRPFAEAPSPDPQSSLIPLEAPGGAESSADEVTISAEEFQKLLERISALEERQAEAGKEAKPAPKLEPTPPKSWFELTKEKWNVKLGGHVQGDYVMWPRASDAIPSQNYFEFRRLRLLADGEGYGVYDFRIQIDLEPEAEEEVNTPVAVIKDAYLTIKEIPVLNRVRFGNFFVPFSLEQVTNDTNNIFLERSIPTTGVFAADREVGVATYNINEAQDITWTFGMFFDSISEALKERVDDNQGYRLSGRLTWLPYYDEYSEGRYLFHTGVGILYTDDHDNRVRFRARPEIHEGPRLIDSGVLDATSYTSANVELATVWGSFSVQSELFVTWVNLANDGPTDLYGGYLYGSYFLTGESRKYERFGQHGAQFGRNVPDRNFFLVPGCHGPGAWELKARLGYLDLTSVDSGQYHDLTVGANWYWTDRIRVMFDWIHPVTTSATTYGKTDSDILGLRFDFNF